MLKFLGKKELLINSALLLIILILCFEILVTPGKYKKPPSLIEHKKEIEKGMQSETSYKQVESANESIYTKDFPNIGAANIFRTIIEKPPTPTPTPPPPPLPPSLKDALQDWKILMVLENTVWIENPSRGLKYELEVGRKFSITTYSGQAIEITVLSVDTDKFSATFGFDKQVEIKRMFGG